MLSFKPIEGWTTPADFRVYAAGGPTTVTNAVYQEIPGVVATTIEPTAAVAAGARWRLDGGAWLESGVSVPAVTPRTHQIEFQAVAGWSTPDGQQIVVPRGGTIIRSGQYVPPPGFALVTAISPKTSPLSGGTVVTIEGVNFQTNATVSFGGTPATSVTVQGATKIFAVVPPRASYGSVNVAIQTAGQTFNLMNAFAYLNPLGSNLELVQCL